MPVLAGPRSVADLPGGLTNRNLRVTTRTGDYVVRLTQSDAGLLGIDRDAEHANSRAAAEAGVGAHVVDYRPDLGMLVITFLPGKALTNETIGAPGVIARAADAVRRLQAGPRFTGDFDMFARQAGYLALVRQHGFPLPDEYDDYAPQWERVRRALAVRPAPTVPCNNDLLAGNFIDDGTRVWLIDYEYSGNNDPAFELGNTATECDLTREQVDELVDSWAGGGVDAGLPRQGRRPVAVLRVRLVAVGLHPGRGQPDGLRLPRVGDGALREGRPPVHQRRLRRAARRVASGG